MVKKISIAIIILAVLTGGIGLYIKSQSTFQKDSKDEAVVQGVQTSIQPEQTFETIIQTSTPIPSMTISPTISKIALSPSKAEKGPYSMEIDPKKTYEAVLTTSLGAITIQFTASKTPITVNNFVTLSRKNFYSNTIFHRVIKGFMIQGGDPKGTGSGGPGYTFADEPFEGEYTRGTVAMANAGPNTNGSQFFVMHKDTKLPKNYVIFGKVISGIEVVDKITDIPTTGMEGSTPVNPVTLLTVEIREK